jgi:hypothetical protein
MEQKRKSITLHDIGCGFTPLLVGIPFGTIFDYLWNWLIMEFALSCMPYFTHKSKPELETDTKLTYCFFITILGFIIDFSYLEIVWDDPFSLWAPTMSQGMQFLWLLLPMVMIAIVNAVLSHSFLEFERKEVAILGVFMGILTAPWIITLAPYALGWVAT